MQRIVKSDPTLQNKRSHSAFVTFQGQEGLTPEGSDHEHRPRKRSRTPTPAPEKKPTTESEYDSGSSSDKHPRGRSKRDKSKRKNKDKEQSSERRRGGSNRGSGRGRGGNRSSSTRTERRQPCPACGGPHPLKYCWHVFPEIHPEGDDKNQTLVDYVSKRIKEDSELKKKVDAARKEGESRAS